MEHYLTENHVQREGKIQVLIADDHQLFREGLKRILNMEKDMEVIGECGDGQQIIELCEKMDPDIILMDINMPKVNGVQATEQIKKLKPDIQIIILSIHDDENYVFETLRKGAVGYLLKDMEVDHLIAAIRAVANGYAYIHPKVTKKLIEHLQQSNGFQPWLGTPRGAEVKELAIRYGSGLRNPLTRRETEVLRLMAEGKSNKAIGESLFISEKTVKNHVSSILQKMGVDDRTQAVIISIKNGWVTLQ